MWYSKNTTFPKWWWRAMIMSLASILFASTLTDWGAVAAIVSAVAAVGLIGWEIGKSITEKSNLKRINVYFLIPKNKYNHKTFPGAPDNEKLVTKLTVGIGSYHILLKIETKKDIFLRRIGFFIDGDPKDKPIPQFKDNGFLEVEQLPDGSYRDWVGDSNIPPKEYLRPLRPNQSLIDCNVIKTTGSWSGRAHVQIETTDTVVDRYLDFVVSLSQDDVPFLKIIDNSSGIYAAPTFPPGDFHQAASTQVGKDPNWRIR